MQHTTGHVTAHSLEPLGIPCLELQPADPLSIAAGQFILGFIPLEATTARFRLFPVRISPDRIVFDHVPDATWFPGRKIDILGPIGNPFSPPAAARRWLMLSLGGHPERLLPLLDAGATQSASLAFWSDGPIPTLAPEVERPASPKDAVDWADFIAIELDGPQWPETPGTFARDHLHRVLAPVQVLIDVPTPCGLGGCQACALPGGKGYSLACQVGLVRPFEELRD